MLELRSWQLMLPRLAELGASIAAVSPQTVESCQTTVEKSEVTFPVLSDLGNELAHSFGLVFELPSELRPLYKRLGADLPAVNGDETFGLPIPATFIIDRNRIIRYAYAEADYTKRADPEDVVKALEEIARSQA